VTTAELVGRSRSPAPLLGERLRGWIAATAIAARPAARHQEGGKTHCPQPIPSFPEKLLASEQNKAEATSSHSVRERNASCFLHMPSAVLPQWLGRGSAHFLHPPDPGEATVCLSFK